MRELQLREAKTTFSEVVDDAANGEPTVVTRHGKPTAVVLGFQEWERLTGHRPTFADLLLSFPDVGEITRDKTPPRDIGT